MEIKPIKTETDYQDVLKKLDQIFDTKVGSIDSDEANILGLLVDEYENTLIPLMLRSHRGH